jgi:hypothetical protein
MTLRIAKKCPPYITVKMDTQGNPKMAINMARYGPAYMNLKMAI